MRSTDSTGSTPSADGSGGQTRNEVALVGRLAAEAVQRELPSGDVLTSWRLVVDRPARRVPEGTRPQTVDTLECVTFAAAVARTATRWQPGDIVSVEGALRRRFWQTPVGAQSRCEVEVVKAKRLSRPT